MTTWELDIAGTRKTLAAWRVRDVTLRLVNLGVDALTFVRDGVDFDSDPLCDFDDAVTLYRDGVKWFEGRRVLVPEDMTASAEGQSYTITGPMQWLSLNVAQQLWSGLFTSHLISIGTGASIITDLLEDAIDRGCPLQVGIIEVPVTPPSNEWIDKLVSAAIQDIMQYQPDSGAWFDYTVSPPRLHIRPRASLASVTLKTPDISLPTEPRIAVLRMTERPDLQVPSVVICFERVNTVDGEQKMVPSREIYPPTATGRENGALISTVSLIGFNATHVKGTLFCEPIEVNNLDWWKRKFPTLADSRLNNPATGLSTLQIAVAAERIGEDGTPSDGLSQEIIEGTAESWMINPDGSEVEWQQEVIKIHFNYKVFDTTSTPNLSTLEEKKEEMFSIRVTATNAPSGETDYEQLASIEFGEAQPVGLAKFLYDSLSPLHYDGVIRIQEQECTGAVKVGQVVNLLGSKPARETMRALVQEVVFHIDSGTTEVTVGPPKQLSLTDLLALLRANRVRRRWTNPATQADGSISANGDVQLGRATANANSVPGYGTSKYFSTLDGQAKIALDSTGKKFLIDFGNNQKVTIDAAAAAWLAATNKELKVMEYGVCVKINNVDTAKKALFVATDYY